MPLACSGPSARPLRALPRVPCPPLAPLPLRCATPPIQRATVWHTIAVYNQGHEEKKIVEKIFFGVCQIFVLGRSGMPPACSRPPARPLRSLPRVPCPRLSHLCRHAAACLDPCLLSLRKNETRGCSYFMEPPHPSLDHRRRLPCAAEFDQPLD